MAGKKHTKEVRAIFKASRIAHKKGAKLNQSWRDRLKAHSLENGELTPKQEAILTKMRKASERTVKLKKKYYAQRKMVKK